MSIVPPPTKPPRGLKCPKETSGLLMTVIRTLSTSESNEQRDREKAKLEKEYKKSDQQLDELVSLHDKDLTQVMQTFGKLSSMVATSRDKIRIVKENLLACKTLLSCRREELKKLWLEGIEHKHVLHLLDEINQLKEVPSQLAAYLSRRQYLSATRLLVSAVDQGDSSLEGVEALKELRDELITKKQQLHLKLIEELNRHIYVDSTQDVELENFKREGSGSGRERKRSRARRLLDFNVAQEPRSPIHGGLCESTQGTDQSSRSSQQLGGQDTTDMQLASYIQDDQDRPQEISSYLMENVQPIGTDPFEYWRTQFKYPNLKIAVRKYLGIPASSVASERSDAIEDMEEVDPLQDPEHFIAVLIECLALLQRLPEAVESLKVGMQCELLALVSRATHQLMPGDSVQLLVDLLHQLMEQFRLVTAAHHRVLAAIAATARARSVTGIGFYDTSDVWSKVQAVLQLLLTDYLDIQNTASEAQQVPSSFSEQTSDIAAYFARRKPQRTRKQTLFRFDYSSHGITINNYLKEQVLPDLGHAKSLNNGLQREKLVVCQPDPNNITLIFIPLMKFIDEIERATGCGPGHPCTLNAFVTDYVGEVFLRRQHALVVASVDAATKSAEAWRAPTTPQLMAQLNLPRPLLQSAVSVAGSLREVQVLMESLPSHALQLLQIVIGVGRSYRETCQAAYRGIVQPDPEDKRVCSAAWLKDDDISRFLKSLPNWTDLQAQKCLQAARKSLKREDTAEEESPEAVRQRNMKEAEILASNLGEGGISSQELIADPQHLKCLAQLQESMEWFAGHITKFSSQLQKAVPASSPTSRNVPTIEVMNADGIPAMPESAINALEQLTREFEELADTCLLVLHLEVRVQCFHYLLSRGSMKSNGSSQDPDPRVLELTKVLVAIDDAMSSSLQPRKSKYIFEGLGHLIAKILMSSSQYMERIDEAGVGRMCRNIFTLQQTLTNITLARETALDHARHYFQLFYLTPDDILSRVLEKGPEFTELEYMNLFQLIHRSQSEHPDPSAIQRHLQRLSDILGEVGVTV